jgi:hypothetical protein
MLWRLEAATSSSKRSSRSVRAGGRTYTSTDPACCADRAMNARTLLSGERVSIIRIDYEDGKPVAVTLEPEGEVRDE